jgi:hypothetical protein
MGTMTVKDVAEQLAAIERSARDPEAAHSMQDDLFRDVLGAIANGKTETPTMLAAAALMVDDIEFPRWMA